MCLKNQNELTVLRKDFACNLCGRMSNCNSFNQGKYVFLLLGITLCFRGKRLMYNTEAFEWLRRITNCMIFACFCFSQNLDFFPNRGQQTMKNSLVSSSYQFQNCFLLNCFSDEGISLPNFQFSLKGYYVCLPKH